MKSFKEYIMILEAIDPEKYEDAVKSKPTSLFLGRLQPIHNGHSAIIKMMKNPVVGIVKGAKSSQDKERNPFDFKYQEKLLKMLHPSVNVIEVKTGYIPDLINTLRKGGIESSEILAGDDRINGYKKQIEGFNKQMPDEKKINVTFKTTPRVTSASKVRELIRADDEKGFQKEVPKQLWKEWETMKTKLGVK